MLQMATYDPADLPVGEWMTIREAALLCHVDYDTFLRWVRNGVLPHYVVGPHRLKRVLRRDVLLQIEPGR